MPIRFACTEAVAPGSVWGPHFDAVAVEIGRTRFVADQAEAAREGAK